jgi:hypothetical protein
MGGWRRRRGYWRNSVWRSSEARSAERRARSNDERKLGEDGGRREDGQCTCEGEARLEVRFY